MAGAQDIAAQATPSGSAGWRALRHASDIQFAPLGPPPPEQPDTSWLGWLGNLFGKLLQALGKVFEWLFAPVGRALGISWPVLSWIVMGLALAVIAAMLWRFAAPALADWWKRRRARATAADPAEWPVDRAAARALLADADALAARGQFDEAVHVLLSRSVDQIAAARPEWLRPASTAREIATLAGLSARARAAFALIAGRVEASRYALRALGREDWAAARAAYADFALDPPARAP